MVKKVLPENLKRILRDIRRILRIQVRKLFDLMLKKKWLFPFLWLYIFINDSLFGRPLSKAKIIGAVGTDGKGSTCILAEAIFRKAGFKTTLFTHSNLASSCGKTNYRSIALLTINSFSGRNIREEAMKQLSKEANDYIIIELPVQCVKNPLISRFIQFESLAFTNLSAEHMNSYSNMPNYMNAKAFYFKKLTSKKTAVLNMDDPHYKYFMHSTKARALTYAIDTDADIMAKQVTINRNRSSFLLFTPQGSIKINMPLIGRFNIYNALAAVGLAFSQGIAIDHIKEGLESVLRIPHRFEFIDRGQPFDVILDFAHTPNGLKCALEAARQLKPGKLISVFSRPGDTSWEIVDRAKRPLMGRIATDLSNFCIITSGSPGTECPDDIVKDVKKGIVKDNYEVVIDRYQAIKKALQEAGAGDLVFINIGRRDVTKDRRGNEAIEFDDRKVILDILKEVEYAGKS